MSSDYITIPLTKGQETIVDPIDADLVEFNWCSLDLKTRYYSVRREPKKDGGRFIFMHRVILSRILDRLLDSSEFADHINGNSLDNRRCNLRLATRQQNNWNSKKPITNTSGYKGVSLHKSSGLWRARIKVDNKEKCLGYFKNPQEAYEAYCIALTEFRGEFARPE